MIPPIKQLFQPVREPVGEKIHKPSLEQANRGSAWFPKDDTAASHELFHPWVETLLDGGRLVKIYMVF